VAGFHRILVGLDESELGQQVFEQALDLAKVYQAQLHFLHVIQDPGPSMSGSSVMSGFSDMGSYPLFSDPNVWETQVQSQKEHAKHWLERYGAQANEAGVTARWSCQMGEPGPVVCEMAKQNQADLILIGRRGLTGLVEALMGSASNYVLHHASCSVLVVQASSKPIAVS
jgi:nucleotide-binding universal stress UspA family protein